MTFRAPRGVSILDAVEYLATDVQRTKAVGVRNGVTTDFEDAWLQSASTAGCIETLGKQKLEDCKSLDTLPKFARRARVRRGALAVALLRAYFRWERAIPKNAVDRTKQCELNCKCGLHGLVLGADRGLFEVYAVMRRLVPALGEWGDGAKKSAVAMLADAEIVLSEWIDKWNKHGDLTTHITVEQFAKKHNVSERTVRDQCESGRLPAKKIPSIHRKGGAQWVIDITDLPAVAAEVESVNISEVIGEVGITVRDEP